MEMDCKKIEVQPTSEGYLPRVADFVEPEKLFQILVNTIKSYHPSENLSMIENAYHLAAEAHKGQVRKSKEPYIIHPLCVALILASLKMDRETIAAALLHDVLEDTTITKGQLDTQFGETVAMLVDGVTKVNDKVANIDKNERKSKQQAESFRKMLIMMGKDIRIIIIKLADRLHNMRTLQYKEPAKQEKIAQETMDIYCPIAGKLGISKLKIELDDLCMKYLHPEETKELELFLEEKKRERGPYIEDMAKRIKECLERAGISASVRIHYKHLFTIYRTMIRMKLSASQVEDYFAICVVVDSTSSMDSRACYGALGAIHDDFTPMPNVFKDHIANPKENQYQSLHTTLVDNGTKIYPIQIRTREMDRVALYGVTATWKYRGDSQDKRTEADKFSWLRTLLILQNDASDDKEFLDSVRDDLNLFVPPISCFTPKGETKYLPKGATAVDFAYNIHTAVGNCMVGVKINGMNAPIDTELRSGDIVEIQTSQNAEGPKKEWLEYAKTPLAKHKIQQWFRQTSKAENIEKGRSELREFCKAHHIKPENLAKPKAMQIVARHMGYHDWESLLAAVGRSVIREEVVIYKLAELAKEDYSNELALQQEEQAEGKKVTVVGYSDVRIRISRCCNPVPGDEIVAYISNSRGAIVHRTDCKNILSMSDEVKREHLSAASWNDTEQETEFSAQLDIMAYDRVGLLADICLMFSQKGILFTGINQQEMDGKEEENLVKYALIQITFCIPSKRELQYLIEALHQISGVTEIRRSA